MACVLERVSLYCGGGGGSAGGGGELGCDTSSQEGSSSTSSSVSCKGRSRGSEEEEESSVASAKKEEEEAAGLKRKRVIEEEERDEPKRLKKEPEEEAPLALVTPRPSSSSPPPPPPPPPPSRSGIVRGQRNYKNMTRERRMEANARERSRVHTISAAFETLRRAVPAYSHNQKLSKLSVLRVAASYILTLSRVVGKDYSIDQSSPSIAECVDNVSNTIQMEGKLRKRKED